MLKNSHSKLRVIALLGLAIISALGIYYGNVNTAKTAEKMCDIGQNTCTIMLSTGSIKVKFLQQPIPEEELYLSFELPKSFNLIEAHIVGLNMYMGKTPVIMQDPQHKGSEIGVTFLGSCNLPEMQWQLNFEVEDGNGRKSSHVATFFTRLD